MDPSSVSVLRARARAPQRALPDPRDPGPASGRSNAPAKLRRACAAYHSATDLPRAGSFSR